MSKRIAITSLWSLLAAACSVQLAPPARVAIGGMPELDASGAGEVRLSAGGVGEALFDGELGARVALTETLSLDGAGVAYAGDDVVMGSVLARYAPFDHPWARLAAVAGPAVGCGAFTVSSTSEPRRTCDNTLAGGGVVGVDLGARLHETTALFLGLRYQLIKAADVPWTHWGLFGAGVRFDLAWAFAAAEGGALVFGTGSARGALGVGHLTFGVTWSG